MILGAKLARFFSLHRACAGRAAAKGGQVGSLRVTDLSFCDAECTEHPWQHQSRGKTPPVALTRATLPAQARGGGRSEQSRHLSDSI